MNQRRLAPKASALPLDYTPINNLVTLACCNHYNMARLWFVIVTSYERDFPFTAVPNHSHTALSPHSHFYSTTSVLVLGVGLEPTYYAPVAFALALCYPSKNWWFSGMIYFCIGKQMLPRPPQLGWRCGWDLNPNLWNFILRASTSVVTV